MNKVERGLLAFCFCCIIGAAVLAALTGCATAPRADAVVSVPNIVTVDRVITASCIKPEEVPAQPALSGKLLNGDAAHDAEILAAEILDDRAWMGQAAALLKACGG